MFRKTIILTLFVSALLAATFALAGIGGSARGGDRDRVAVISVKDFNIKKFEGKVVLVGFWRGAKCEPCLKYLEWMSEMQEIYGEDGLITVAVNQDGDQSTGGDLFPVIHSKTQIIIDPTGKMGSAYHIEVIPSTYLYDRNLELIFTFMDFTAESPEPMEQAIQELIKVKYKH